MPEFRLVNRLLVCAILCVLVMGEALAAELTVTRFDDPAPGTCDVGDCSLREAIIAANTTTAADTIALTAGVYQLQVAGAAEDAAAMGDLDVLEDLSITGAGREDTIIDGGKLDRIFEVLNNTTDFDLTALTLRNARVTTLGGAGLLLNSDGTVDVADCSVISNETTSTSGGGLSNRLGGTLTITESIISGNVSSSRGGGIGNESTGGLTVTDSEVKHNLSNSSGGGLANQSTGGITITGSTIMNNVAGQGGGGIANNGGGAISLSNSTVSSNVSGVSTSSSGGGIFNSGVGEVTLSTTRISGNISSDNGGGVGNNSTGTVTITRSLIDGNVSQENGGGINNEGAGTVSIVNTTISGNTSSGDGGGIHHDDTNGVTSATNCTITLNSSRGTDAVYLHNGNDFTLTNTLVVDNLVGGDCSNSAGQFKDGGNNLMTTAGCMIFGGGTFPVGLPKLGALADNGGPLFTHALLDDSDAIDAGGEADCPTTDARGFDRPIDGDSDGAAKCDIGAFEKGFDCNSNGVDDVVDISSGASTDCDTNDIPDDCQTDTDEDGSIDACDACDSDPGKTEVGVCGCGVADDDENENGVVDCQLNAELHARVASLISDVQSLKSKTDKATKNEIKADATDLKSFVESNANTIDKIDAEANLKKLVAKAFKKVRKSLKAKGRKLKGKKRQAIKSLNALDAAVQ